MSATVGTIETLQASISTTITNRLATVTSGSTKGR